MVDQISVHEDPQLAGVVHQLALEEYEGPGEFTHESREKFAWLKDLETQLWLDTGDADAAARVWSVELQALTTNNTLVNQVVQTGVMDDLIVRAVEKIRQASPGITHHDLVIELAFLVNAKIALSLVSKFGANVSVELHPDVGFDVHSSLVFARRYYAINPSHFYVKIPLTPDGFISARRLSCDNIPINFTLGFSARQNYLAARFSGPRFVNVFLGRLNSLVEENKLGDPTNVGEKAALASYEWVRDLRKSHADIYTYQIAASMRSGNQVVTLAGVDVLTIPPKVAQEYLDLSIHKADIRRHTSDELEVNVNYMPDSDVSNFEQLWTVDAQFIGFVEDAVRQADQLTDGPDLVRLAQSHDVNLFYGWSAEDRQRIREKGKIPDLSQWPGAPLDDLMSISALESFAKDQLALDNRIGELVRSV
ncbi:transaldolase family protein [bacterium]|nr:transaldolase family protein [bacterium]